MPKSSATTGFKESWMEGINVDLDHKSSAAIGLQESWMEGFMVGPDSGACQSSATIGIQESWMEGMKVGLEHLNPLQRLAFKRVGWKV